MPDIPSWDHEVQSLRKQLQQMIDSRPPQKIIDGGIVRAGMYKDAVVKARSMLGSVRDGRNTDKLSAQIRALRFIENGSDAVVVKAADEAAAATGARWPARLKLRMGLGPNPLPVTGLPKASPVEWRG